MNIVSNCQLNEEGQAIVERVHEYAKEAGRDPKMLPLEGRVRIGGNTPDDWARQTQLWKNMGATHIIAEARGGELVFPDDHIAAIRQYKQEIIDT
jgi:alkanesulfonate monooxygenase SsuD/methylene tetrahydromethanopterin reductase-like flavin-dependent oxidoreductase (luciferase family)